MKAVIDIGNTNIKVGWLSSRGEIVRTTAFPVASLVDAFAGCFDEYIQSVAIAASGQRDVSEQIKDHFKTKSIPVVAVSGSGRLPFESRYGAGQAGIDRLANVAAVSAEGSLPAIVIDAGSAITTEVVDSQGVFLGGAILPGLKLQAQALHRGTAALPELIDSAGALDLPAVGRDTETAIRAGLLHGVAGGVERLIALSKEVLDGGTQPRLVVTGGDAPFLAPLLRLPGSIVDPTLTLRGITLLARYQFPHSY